MIDKTFLNVNLYRMDFDDDEFDDDEYDFEDDEEEEEEDFEDDVVIATIEAEPKKEPKLVELFNTEDVFRYLQEILKELAQITDLPKVRRFLLFPHSHRFLDRTAPPTKRLQMGQERFPRKIL